MEGGGGAWYLLSPAKYMLGPWQHHRRYQLDWILILWQLYVNVQLAVNNAGLALSSLLECVPINMAKELFEVNFFGTLRLIQAVLPGMKAKRSGFIINNSSHFGIVGPPFYDLYTASKFAVEGLTESLAPALRHFDIRCSVNSQCNRNFLFKRILI